MILLNRVILAHCRGKEKSDKSIRPSTPPDGTHNGHLTAMIKTAPKRAEI